MTRSNRRTLALPIVAVGVAALVAASPARAGFFQGFETNTTGWNNSGNGTITRVPTGTDGIVAGGGSWYGKITQSPASGGGPFTNYGGYSSTFPTGGYIASVMIYLDMAGGYANDTRFDFSSAINNQAGAHRRDFVFNAGFYNDGVAPGTGNRFVVSASTTAGRSNSYPKNPGRSPIVIDTTGWYTFQHYFHNVGGALAVDMSILDGSNQVVGTWTLSDPSDLIASLVGGNRYGWFASNEFSSLAIDNSSLTVVPEPTTIVAAGFGLLFALGAARRRARAGS